MCSLEQHFYFPARNFSFVFTALPTTWNKKPSLEISLAVQWLRLCTSNAREMGLIPGQGTKMPHAAWCSKTNKRPRFQAFDMPPSLSLIMSSFWLKIKDMSLFLPLEQGFNWPNFNTVVSWRIGKLEERERDGEMASWQSSQDTHIIYWLNLLSWAQFVACQDNNIKDHWSQTTITNTMMKKFEILRELQKMWRKDMKWANAGGKSGTNRFSAGLPQMVNL